MMFSDFITAIGTLFDESIFLMALRLLVLISAIKISFNFVRYWSSITLAFLLWLSVFVLYVAVHTGTSALMLVRFEVILFFGVTVGIGYVCYGRLGR